MVLLLFGVSSALVSIGIPGVVGLSLAAMSQDIFPKLGQTPDLYTAVLVLALLLFARLIFALLTQVLNVRLTQTSNLELHKSFHRHILSLSQGEYQRLGEDKLMGGIFFELNHIAMFFQSGLHRFVSAAVVLLGSLAVMATLAPALTFVVALVAPATFLTMRLANRRLRSLSKEYWARYAIWRDHIIADIQHLYLLKAFSQLDHRHQTQLEKQKAMMSLEMRRDVFMHSLNAVNQVIAFVAIAGVAILAHQGNLGEPLQMTGLLTFVLYGTALTSPLREVADLYREWQAASGAIQRVDDILNATTERSGGATINVKGSIEFQDVFFAYRSSEPVLKGVNLKINTGETVALIGTNGAGKTTLLALLAGFWEPDSGQILIDENPCQNLSLQTIRRAVTVVPQHTEMFEDTIFENIRFGRPDASEEDVRRAAYLANADDFIDKLEQGYQTRVGYQGIKLSGGQRQRIALARAILYDAPIVVLDEATSMFDPESEVEVLRRLNDWIANKTVILVTHRPAPLELVDRTLRLQDGHITG